MENRLCLNKRPVYELPNEVLVGLYQDITGRKVLMPNFEPDLCLNLWGNVGTLRQKCESSNQLWIKTDNNELRNFIINYDYKSRLSKITNAYSLSVNLFKKIILEEFYEVKYGE